MVIGACAALLVVLAVALASQPRGVQTKTATLGDREALSIVASAMRSGDAAAEVLNAGQARFEDGSWYLTVGPAALHFSERNRIVVPDNPAAIDLLARATPRSP
jgi:hypothetical protein